MRKYILVIMSILCLSLILSCFVCKSNATGLDILQNPDAYKQSSDDNSGAIEIGNIVVWLVRTVGEAIGIKYLLGSVEEKAEYKQSMWPYVLGAVLIFAGAALTNVIYQAFN